MGKRQRVDTTPVDPPDQTPHVDEMPRSNPTSSEVSSNHGPDSSAAADRQLQLDKTKEISRGDNNKKHMEGAAAILRTSGLVTVGGVTTAFGLQRASEAWSGGKQALTHAGNDLLGLEALIRGLKIPPIPSPGGAVSSGIGLSVILVAGVLVFVYFNR